ncbi:hypothetical protein MA16_Dca027664 [Dendrobium catenatum]|uniref:Uncharacterized protein n=1 Tax=Dendrobium catenatum TaxID=906689 RepID=A0A2I0VEC4_9ASPA|nr:hypothetical protein MA16_Dca027664 [Dendrobium catenatum]
MKETNNLSNKSKPFSHLCSSISGNKKLLSKLVSKNLENVTKHDNAFKAIVLLNYPNITYYVRQSLHHEGHQRASRMANNGILQPPTHPRRIAP